MSDFEDLDLRLINPWEHGSEIVVWLVGVLAGEKCVDRGSRHGGVEEGRCVGGDLLGVGEHQRRVQPAEQRRSAERNDVSYRSAPP